MISDVSKFEGPWWEKWPGLLSAELVALRDAGIGFRVNEELQDSGILQLDLAVRVADETHRLVATYPEHYPYFRFEVQAPDLDLQHHQHPAGKNLCLIGRSTEKWDTNNSLADFLSTRFPEVLKTGRSEDLALVRGAEEEQAEPYSDYYGYEPESIMIVDRGWRIPQECTSGPLSIGVLPQGVGQKTKALRGVVLTIEDDDGNLLCKAEAPVEGPTERVIAGRWVRSTEKIPEFHSPTFIEKLLREHPHSRKVPVTFLGGEYACIWGILFPEEIGYRVDGEGWLFTYLRNKNRNGLAADLSRLSGSSPQRPLPPGQRFKRKSK